MATAAQVLALDPSPVFVSFQSRRCIQVHVARLGVIGLLLVGCSRDTNVPVQGLEGLWSIGAAAGDVLIAMDSVRTEASWFFVIERSACSYVQRAT